MAKINLNDYMDKQLDFFIEKFKKIGWKQEDTHYIFKRVGFETNPSARNKDYKYGFGIVFYAELLNYSEINNGKTEEVLTPWVVCRIQIDKNENIKYPIDCPRLQKVVNFIKEEIKKIEWKPFYDEDAFKNNFSRPKIKENMSSVEIKFYLNMEYPNGHWENHTL
jgi:hypothetical protein